MPRKSLLIASLLLSLLHPPPSRAADVPMLLNYQGNLTDPGGALKNGTFSMTFSVYDAATGGNQLPSGTPWSEIQSVTITNGAFNVLLGSVTALPTDLFAGGPSDSSGPLRFLQVAVNGEALAPRRRIASAAYSLHGRVGPPSAATAVGTTDAQISVNNGNPRALTQADDMSVTLITSGTKLLITFGASFEASGGGDCAADFALEVDGVETARWEENILTNGYGNGGGEPISLQWLETGLTPGPHVVRVMWAADKVGCWQCAAGEASSCSAPGGIRRADGPRVLTVLDL